MSLDLDQIGGYEETADIQIVDPRTLLPLTGQDGTPWLITVAGPNHAITRRLMDDALKRASRRQELGRAGRDDGLEEIEARNIENLVARSLGWTPAVTLPFSQANAAEVYRKYDWVRRQVNQFLSDEANFLKLPRPPLLPMPSTSAG
jgi:hypothetical protein